MHTPRPRVILITYYFRPSTEMGALRPTRFYKYLKAMGYACHVITATAQGNDCPADIQVIPDRLQERWEKGSGRHSFGAYVELLIRQFLFPGHIGMLWSLKVAAECRRIRREHPKDRFALVVTYPPLGTLLVGLFAGGNTLPWIADFRDPIAALILKGEPGYVKFWARLLEKRVFRGASAIIANVEPAAVVWRERYPWAQPKLHVIYNGFDPQEAPRARPIPPRNYKLLVHAGTFYHGRNADVVLESLARLRAKGAPEALAAKVLLAGVEEGEPWLNWELCRAAERDGRLELRGRFSWEEWEQIVGEADGLLLAQQHSTIQIPAKLYGYVAIGRPVLVLLARSSPVEAILKNSAVAHVIIYSDEGEEITDRKLVEFLRMPNTPAPINDWFRANFSCEVQTEALARIIDEVAR